MPTFNPKTDGSILVAPSPWLSRKQVKPWGVFNSFVFHFRGSTLEPGPCKNGWLDCASWQANHRPDMDSAWFSSKEAGLE